MARDVNKLAILDVDSVLLDFYEFFHAHLKGNFGLNIPDGYIPSDFMYGDLVPKEIFKKAISSLGSNWPEKLSPYRGASPFTHKLSDLGCRIVIVTHVEESMKNARIRNLIRHNILFDEIYFPYGEPKSEVISAILPRYKNLERAIFVDDHLKNVVDVDRLHAVDKSFCLNYPFNEHLKSQIKNKKRIDIASAHPEELYRRVLKYIQSA